MSFWRRTVTYNRQPRRLFLLPFALASVALGVYALVTGSASVTLMFVVVGLMIFVNVVDGLMWLARHVRVSITTK